MTVLTLPTSPGPNAVNPRLLDFGMILRPATGAPAQHFARPGSRFAVDVSFPPMRPDTARPFVRRLIAGKTEGLRIYFPLLGVTQGNPGSPLVKTATAGGTSLPLKGLTAGYAFKEGWWLTVIDAAGVYYLHTIDADGSADGSGDATPTVRPPLRAALAVNDVVLLQRPMIEGLVTSDASWELPTNRLVQLSFTLEEQA